MVNKHITLYYKKHYDANCSCSYCVNKKGISNSLRKLGYIVRIEKFKCNWESFYPAGKHFDYAIAYQNKIFGEFMFEADKMPANVVEFAKNYLDYIICGSKFLYDTWLNSGIEEKFLIPASLGIDTKIFNTHKQPNIIYQDKFKFLAVGAWQHKHWDDRKGLNKLIKIFKKLFSSNKKVMLIIKSDSNAPDDARVDNIKFIKNNLSEEQMADLYRSCSLNGAYLSLHSGEGFGRTNLEALSCGCNIGSTGWSGVLDFLNNKNSTLFSYNYKDSSLYGNEYYLDRKQPKIADVNMKEVKKWMLEIVKKSSIKHKNKTQKKYDWNNVVKELMKEIEDRI